MKPVRQLLDKVQPHFEQGGKFEKLHPVFEAFDTFFYTSGEVTEGASHVRDGLDLKRMMTVVVLALVPCIVMALWNTGYQANLQLAEGASVPGWRGSVLAMLGAGSLDPNSLWANLVHGAVWYVPVFIVTNVVGLSWEFLFCVVRKHELNEGFLVTGMLFPLTLPPMIPLWQVALGISFGVVLGKEVFGGTGKNFLNPALTARAFLYFAFAIDISGASVWTAVDGYTAATPLGAMADASVESLQQGVEVVVNVSWSSAFLGTIPGSMGETSTLACLFGAGVLILTGVGSWRIMAGVLAGSMGFATLLYAVGSETNPMFQLSPMWHLVTGGLAFGLVFMATDPVSASMTEKGKWIYGGLIGVMTILVRSCNPAFPEGIMLAILFGNVFAPLIDYFVVQANIKRRLARNAA